MSILQVIRSLAIQCGAQGRCIPVPRERLLHSTVLRDHVADGARVVVLDCQEDNVQDWVAGAEAFFGAGDGVETAERVLECIKVHPVRMLM
jgi:hypothetical protein